MDNHSYQITKLEMTITLVSMIIGVGILTLPRALAKAIGTPDGWIAIILGAVINMFIVYLIVRLHRNFPGKTFIGSWGDKHIGKWVGKLFSVLFLVYFVILVAYEARILTVVVKIYLLDRSPTEVVALLVILATTFAVTKGVQGIVHLNLMFFPIVMLI
ncbi:GerAB/ArcD/ProY family transporter [Anaerobacillus sp. CMMVII]|nr:GerAB/ArcD/ProY family transporter [Anaerobacillus sp. CMMVII]